jgi:uncharacterized protein YcbX
MAAKIVSLTRYPVKGLSGQSMDRVELKTGQGFPQDRRFGFARPGSGFDPDSPKPLPKTKFYMLARDAALVNLNTEFTEDNGILSIKGPGVEVSFNITTDDGKRQASELLKSYLQLPEAETPQLFEASPHRFTDVSVDSTEMMNAVSIINLDSVKQFAKDIDQNVDARRFRGNIQLEGMAAFTELEMVGRMIAIGNCQLKIVRRTKRCPATEVDLNTGERNIRTPKELLKQYGHMDMGVYAEVVEGGVISPGDTVEVL